MFSGLLADSALVQIDRIAVIAYMPKTSKSVAGARTISCNDLLKGIIKELSPSEREVPEQFFLLRTLHWVGYYRKELFEQIVPSARATSQ